METETMTEQRRQWREFPDAWEGYYLTGDLSGLLVYADLLQERGQPFDSDLETAIRRLAKLSEAARDGVHFFFVNAMASYDPAKEHQEAGWLRGAAHLTRAEEYASAKDWVYEWLG